MQKNFGVYKRIGCGAKHVDINTTTKWMSSLGFELRKLGMFPGGPRPWCHSRSLNK